MMKREDDRELWDLLGNAGEPKLSPFFARNVVRSVRQERSWWHRLVQQLPPRRLVPAAAIALAIAAAAMSLSKARPDSATPDNLRDTIAQLDPIDFQVIAELDDLLALEEDNLWDDGDTSTL